MPDHNIRRISVF